MAPSAMKNGVDACPDLETLAAYIDGRLTESERAHIAEHLATCETCYFAFAEAAQTDTSPHHNQREAAEPQQHSVPGPVPSPRPRWWTAPAFVWSSAASLAIAAGLVLAVATGFISGGDAHTKELSALVAAVGTERSFEPRVTGGFAHGPIRAVRGGALASAVSPDVRIAAAQLEKAALSDRRVAESLHVRGIAALMTGDLDRAVALLEKAAAEKATDAQIQSDLSAAYLARATAASRSDDFAKGLAAANRAINVSRVTPEALFNRAYALERLSLLGDARDAWRAYLVVDNQSGWADEARAHLRVIEEGR